MKRKRFTTEQIIGILKQFETGTPVTELARQHGVTDKSIYMWRKKYGGMQSTEAKRLKELEDENKRLKRMVADLMLDKQILTEVNAKKW